MSVNHVILVGRLGRDPESRFTGSGMQVANFSIATDETWKDKNGEKQKKTEWHRLVAWGKLAEIVTKYLTKGSLIYIEGSLSTRKWQDKEDITRYSTDITVKQLRMLGGGEKRKAGDDHNDADESASGRVYGDGTASRAQSSEISDEDIPF